MVAPAVGDHSAGEPAALVGPGEGVGPVVEAEVGVPREGVGKVAGKDRVGEFGGDLLRGASGVTVGDPVREAFGQPQRGGRGGPAPGGHVRGLVGGDHLPAEFAEDRVGAGVDHDALGGGLLRGAHLPGGHCGDALVGGAGAVQQRPHVVQTVRDEHDDAVGPRARPGAGYVGYSGVGLAGDLVQPGAGGPGAQHQAALAVHDGDGALLPQFGAAAGKLPGDVPAPVAPVEPQVLRGGHSGPVVAAEPVAESDLRLGGPAVHLQGGDVLRPAADRQLREGGDHLALPHPVAVGLRVDGGEVPVAVAVHDSGGLPGRAPPARRHGPGRCRAGSRCSRSAR